MDNEKCDLISTKGVKPKKLDEVDGYTIKYHANGKTIWSKGKIINDKPEGYWEWYRLDGTLKRSGYFELGEPVGEWVTYDSQGMKYKATMRNK
jgi:antitoxin component YwqK of YwqJK toxin-antitoxin module